MTAGSSESRILIQMVADLRQDLEARGAVDRGQATDRLLVAIVEAWGGELFTVGQLLRHAAALEEPALAAAVFAIVGSDGDPGKRLGRLLAKVQGQPFGGLIVQEHGTEAAGRIWAVRPASEGF